MQRLQGGGWRLLCRKGRAPCIFEELRRGVLGAGPGLDGDWEGGVVHSHLC